MTRIYVDDSGDPGLGRRSSSPFFFIGASEVEAPDDLENIVTQFRHDRIKGRELKFEKLSDQLRTDFLVAVRYQKFHVHLVNLDKARLGLGHGRDGGLPIYQQMVLCALEKSIGESASECVTIDKTGCRGQSEKEIITFLKRGLNHEIRRAKEVRFRDSRKDVLLQFADVVLGASARAIRSKDNRFSRIIESRVSAYSWPE